MLSMHETGLRRERAVRDGPMAAQTDFFRLVSIEPFGSLGLGVTSRGPEFTPSRGGMDI